MTVAGIVLLAGPLLAQVQVGDNLNLNATGSVSADYNDTWGNITQSGHGLSFGMNGALTGFYYNPNFLSFSINPYFNQSRANSNFQSITNSSGLSLSSSLFSGSHFPGSVHYRKSYNSQGSFGLPGLPNFTTTGNNQSFGVNWSELLPGLPTLTAGFQMGRDNYSLFGSKEEGGSRFHSIFLTSTYDLDGYRLSAGVNMGASHAIIPGLFAAQGQQTSDSDTRNFNVAVSHPLPWSGNFGSSYSRSYIHSDYLGYRFNGNIDTVVVGAGFHPTQKFSMSLNTDYSDNLSGSLYQAIVPPQGGGGPGAPIVGAVQGSESSSYSWDMGFLGTYSFAPNLQGQAQFQRRQQYYSGLAYSSINYGGGVNYHKRLVGGSLGAGVYANGNRVDKSGENTLGLNADVAYNRRFGKWTIGSSVLYGQNMQTLLVTYLSSYYTVSGNVSRRFGPLFWNSAASAYRTGLSAYKGTSSSGESYSSSIGTGRINFGGAYSRSNGNSLANASGLIQPPIPPIIPGGLQIMYGGNSYSFSASGSPIRRLTFTVSYLNADTNSNNQGVTSWNNMKQQSAFVQYQFRQVGVRGGYSRLEQGFSGSGTAPENLNSFSIGIYRWFSFF